MAQVTHFMYGTSSTYRADAFTSASATNVKEGQITAAIAAAVADGVQAVFVPQFMLPYNASLVTFNTAVRMIREGGNPATCDVRAYGAAGNCTGVFTGTDDTVAFQAAANASTVDSTGTDGGVFFMPSGRYKITAPVTFYTNLSTSAFGAASIRGAGRASTIVVTNIAEVFKVGTATSTLDNFAASDFTIELGATIGYQLGAMHLILVRAFALDNITLTGGSAVHTYGGFLFDIDSSYEGNISNCNSWGRKTYLYDVNVRSRSTEQIDCVNMRNCTSHSVYCGFTRDSGLPQPVGHGRMFTNVKHVPTAPGFTPENSVDVNTTLSSAPAAAATSFTITSATSIAIGDLILVDIGELAEPVEIANLVGTTVTTTSPLRFAHASGVQVLKGCVAHVICGQVFNLTFDQPHMEVTTVGFMLGGAASGGPQQLSILNPYSGCKDMIRVVNGINCQNILVRGGSYYGNIATNRILRVLAAADDVSFGKHLLAGPFFQITGGAATLVPYLNDAGAQRQIAIWQDDTPSGGNGSLQCLTNFPAGSSAPWLWLNVGGLLRFYADATGLLRIVRKLDAAAALTWAANVTIDMSTGQYFTLTATSNIAATMLAPTGSAPGAGVSQEITVEYFNNSGGALTTPIAHATGAGAFLASGGVQPANGLTIEVKYRFNQARNRWIEVCRGIAV